GDLAAPGRMPDVDGVSQIELLDQLGEIIGISIEVVAVPGLAGAAMPAAVMRDAAEATRGQEEHLILECIRAERPAVAEHHRLSRPPVVEIDFSTVLGGDRAHVALLIGCRKTIDGSRARRAMR